MLGFETVFFRYDTTGRFYLSGDSSMQYEEVFYLDDTNLAIISF